MNGEKDTITIYIVAASPIARAGLEAVLQAGEKLIVAGGAAEIPHAPLNFSAGRAVDILLVNVERQKEFDDLSEFLGDNGVDEDSSSPFVVALLSTEFQNSRQAIELLQSGARNSAERRCRRRNRRGSQRRRQ